MTVLPPKPASRPKNASLWKHMKLFRQDVLSSQPEHLYGAWMAEFKVPFFHTFMVNQPDLVKKVLNESLTTFPKSRRIRVDYRRFWAIHCFYPVARTGCISAALLTLPLRGGVCAKCFQKCGIAPWRLWSVWKARSIKAPLRWKA